MIGWRQSAPDGLPASYAAMILLGLAAGWQGAASQRILAAAIGPEPEVAATVAATALLAAAVGPWLPGRLILGIARFIQRRGRRADATGADSTATFWILRAVRERDDSLTWLSISVLACAAGILSLATLLLMTQFAGLYHYLIDRFFWTRLTLSVVEWLGIGLLIGPSWVLHGLLVTTLAAATGRIEPARRPPGVVAGAIFGLGLALLVHVKWAAGVLSGGQEFMAGVLPMFALAALAARMSQRSERLPNRTPAEAAAPELPGGAQSLIWLLLGIWGIATALVGTGWVLSRGATGSGRAPAGGQWGWYMTALGIGTAAAWWHARRQTRSTSGCGMAVWAGGLGAGAAVSVAAFSPEGTISPVVQVLLLGLPLGYALHYAEHAWLVRAGSESQGFAQLASAVLAGLAAGFMAACWWGTVTLGPIGLITAGSLLMMAFGGIVQVYEEDRPARVRHRRLALVFASLGAAIVVFPTATRRWDRWETVRATGPLPTELSWLATTELPSARRVCLVGVDWHTAIQWPGLGKARVDILPGRAPGRTREPPSHPPGRTRISHGSPFRSLRLEHEVYDLVYQQGRPMGGCDGYPEYSIEWLTRLAGHTMPDGQLVVDVPLTRMTPEALAAIAATLERAANAPARWLLATAGGRPVVRFAVNPRSADPLSPGDDGWSPVASLLADAGSPRPHSIQNDRITSALAVHPQPTLDEILAWLQTRRLNGRQQARGQ